MAWYLCTISASSKRNWELCKESQTWGINTSAGYASMDKARKKDNLLFYLATVGFIGFAEVAEDTRPPKSSAEAPWLGGISRFGLVIPLKPIKEFSKPYKLKFIDKKQEITNLDNSMFQRGYMPINDSVGELIVDLAGS
jgi:EVE domain